MLIQLSRFYDLIIFWIHVRPTFHSMFYPAPIYNFTALWQLIHVDWIFPPSHLGLFCICWLFSNVKLLLIVFQSQSSSATAKVSCLLLLVPLHLMYRNTLTNTYSFRVFYSLFPPWKEVDFIFSIQHRLELMQVLF